MSCICWALRISIDSMKHWAFNVDRFNDDAIVHKSQSAILMKVVKKSPLLLFFVLTFLGFTVHSVR